MKKNLLKLLAILAAVTVLPLACNKPAPEPEPEPEPGPEVPECQELALKIAPAGEDITCEITATDAWTVETDENYKWISCSPKSGDATESTTLTFTASANDSGRERSATFYVMQGTNTIYEIFISQSKLEVPLGAGDYEFLKAVVDGKMLGDDTPVVEDWYSFDAESFSGTGIDLTNKDGLWYVVQIDGTPFVNLPEKLELTEIEVIRLNNQTGLTGVLFPTVWNTPKLQVIALSHTKMTGVIPAGFAASPVLNQIYFDDTDFYGALPHNWASKCLEVVLLGSTSNTNSAGDDPYANDTECPYLGYIVPASLDVILNSERVAQTDKTQMKVGGVKEGHWLGFEEGWGQTRYELFDENAVKGDTKTWSDWRLLIGKAEKDPDVWAWYFSNMGYTDFRLSIPKKMLVWDQAVADAFTKAAKIAHDSRNPIDMTAFGKEPEVIPDDDIQSGNVVNVDEAFWN